MITHDPVHTYNKQKSLKRATNLTLNIEVLAEAKKLGINISKVCDAFLESLVRQEKERLWKLENAKFKLSGGFNA